MVGEEAMAPTRLPTGKPHAREREPVGANIQLVHLKLRGSLGMEFALPHGAIC